MKIAAILVSLIFDLFIKQVFAEDAVLQQCSNQILNWASCLEETCEFSCSQDDFQDTDALENAGTSCTSFNRAVCELPARTCCKDCDDQFESFIECIAINAGLACDIECMGINVGPPPTLLTNPPSPAPNTPAPVAPAPINPAPVTSAPITTAPVTVAPVTSAPFTPAPITDAPVTSPAPAIPDSSSQGGLEVFENCTDEIVTWSFCFGLDDNCTEACIENPDTSTIANATDCPSLVTAGCQFEFLSCCPSCIESWEAVLSCIIVARSGENTTGCQVECLPPAAGEEQEDPMDSPPAKEDIPLMFDSLRKCTPASPCAQCEGDCDTDDDCEGDLICFQKERPADMGGSSLVPGCNGMDFSRTDWCITPSSLN